MSRDFWYCNVCQAQNSREDGECQFCECGGKDCKRDSCSDPRHFMCDCGGRGWGIFNNDKRGLEIERCDACQIYASDEDAEKSAGIEGQHELALAMVQ